MIFLPLVIRETLPSTTLANIFFSPALFKGIPCLFVLPNTLAEVRDRGAAVGAKSIFKVYMYMCIWSWPANNVLVSAVLVRRWADSPRRFIKACSSGNGPPALRGASLRATCVVWGPSNVRLTFYVLANLASRVRRLLLLHCLGSK